MFISRNMNISEINDIPSIGRVIKIFGDLAEITANISLKKAGTRLPYFYTLMEIMTAIGLAFGNIYKKDMNIKQKLIKEQLNLDDEWSLEISKLISRHIEIRQEKYMRNFSYHR